MQPPSPPSGIPENISTISDLGGLVVVLVALLGFATYALRYLESERVRQFVAITIITTSVLVVVTLVYRIAFPSDAPGEEIPAESVRAAMDEAPPALEPEPAPEPAPVPEPAPEPAPVPERQTLTYSYGERNGHCSDARMVRWPVNAPAGWRIVRGSINMTGATSSRSEFYGVSDVRDDGFFVTGLIANSGNCIRAFGQTIARDARGRLNVSGTYVVERIREVTGETGR